VRRYLVGGAVRDRLLGRSVTERDWGVGGAGADDLIALGYRRVGRDFPVFIHPDSGEEHTLACRVRGDLATAGPDVTLDEDLRARDLTVNALAEDTDGRVMDCVGGLADLDARVLRHVDAAAFASDPLRVLRTVRLAAELSPLGFRVAVETRELMARLAAQGTLDGLTPERVWKELVRALESAAPQRFFAELHDLGALGRVLPEIERLWGVPQPPHWHPEIDTGVHTLMALEQAARLSADPVVRFAALAHDLGKGTTPPAILPSHRGHAERGVAIVDQLCDRLRAPARFRELARLVARHHGTIHRVAELRPGTLLDLLEAIDAFRRPERLGQVLTACEADYRGRLGFEDRPYPHAGRVRAAFQAASAVNAAAIAAATPERIADLLRQARVAAIRRVDRPRKPA
jgi:tRNA nucleotidyltransferase (CCA-adding enzyme)